MINGILNVYKEKGYTSHDVVARLRGIVGQRKIGHTGTLDPEAEGVLPVCLGRATKVCDVLTDKDKTYEAVLLLGITTDTQDITGHILSECPVFGLESKIDEDRVRADIMSFVGEYDQIPPMYSALKVGGKKLYELAREGKTVERKSRKVNIYNIQIKEICLPRIRITVDCSKGTYIRTLCHDIGEKLGCGGCMESLLRIRAGRFGLENSVRLDEIQRIIREGRLNEILMRTDQVFEDLPSVYTKKKYDKLAHNGSPLEVTQITGCFCGSDDGCRRFRLYDSRKEFVGIYCSDGSGSKLRPEKMFFDPEQMKEPEN